MAPLRPDFGPELPVLVARRLGWPLKRTRILIIGVFVALVLVQVARLVATSGSGLTNDALVTEPFAFTLGYRDGLERVAPQPGEALRLVSKPGGSTDERFSVSELKLPPYRGDPAGPLAVLAGKEIDVLRRQFPDGFRYRGDMRTRINDFPGHLISFQTRIDGRLFYGKRYLLLPAFEAPDPPPREGAQITLLSRYSKATPSVDAVGAFGLMKSALRSFRLGTERP